MRMAYLMGILVLFLAAITPAPAAEPLQPTIGYVSGGTIEVRSGPGEEFYATGELHRGATVEIYREHGEGWLAIRPPAGSHAWVTADSLQVTDDAKVAEVAGELVEAWVGADSPGVRRHLWQVRLERGEVVELLGEQRLVTRADRGRETWLKIAPPSGEFRYVHRDAIELKTDKQDRYVRPAAHTAPAAKKEWKRAPDAKVDDDAKTASQGELSQIDIALSFMVAQPLENWDLATLKQRALEIAENGAAPLERGHARRMLEQIGEFEDLHLRWRLGQSAALASFDLPDDAGDLAGETVREVFSDLDGGEVGTGLASLDENRDEPEMQYDGAGRLRKVYSKNRVAPPYVLVDEQNNVLRFVTPAPGLNLNRYLEDEVGVFGQVGDAPPLQAPLITAERIVRLDRHRR